MIREWIGGFVLGCIEAHKGQQFMAKIDQVDLAKLTNQQLSDFVHGRSIDWKAVEPAALRPAKAPSRSNVQEEIDLRQRMEARNGPRTLRYDDILEHLQRWEPDAGSPFITWESDCSATNGKPGERVTVTTAAEISDFTRGLLDAWMPAYACLTFVVRP